MFFGSIEDSEYLTTYPSPQSQFCPKLARSKCSCWLRGGVGGQLPRNLSWSFFTVNDLIFFCADPSSVELNIDGSTDKCSKGEDINFIFTGFTLSGKVSFVPFNSLFTQHGEFKSCMTFLYMITLRKKKGSSFFFPSFKISNVTGLLYQDRFLRS